MVYLQRFKMPTRENEEHFFDERWNYKVRRTCYSTTYPFVLFRNREFPEFTFEDITIFCGDNGSGKSTILNVIAEKLGLTRTVPFNRSDFFDDYVNYTEYQLSAPLSEESKIITSDGVFEKVLDIRRINDGIDSRRADLIREYVAERKKDEPNLLEGLDDYDRWKRARDIRSKNGSQSRFIKDNLIRNVVERSNGESALSYFVDSITENALYLLDEPENSLSPQNQLRLKEFIEDSVRNFGCQFIISTHSPFLLSLENGKIYDIDVVPPAIKNWTELDCVKVYHAFFKKSEEEFR